MRKLKLILHPKQIEGDHVGTRNLISAFIFEVWFKYISFQKKLQYIFACTFFPISHT